MDRGMLGTAYETNLRDALQTTGGSLSTFTGQEELPTQKLIWKAKATAIA